MNTFQPNCSEVRTNRQSALTVIDSLDNNVTETSFQTDMGFIVDNESQRIITESHQNSWQTALLYISIILSIYLMAIMFIGVRYALNKYYDKNFYSCCPTQCSECCPYCSTSSLCFRTAKSRRTELIISSPTSSRMTASHIRDCNSDAFISPDDLNTIEVTSTYEACLETDL